MKQTHHPNRILELRRLRGFTAAELAAMCDPPISESTISKLENSVSPLDQDRCILLAGPLRCRPSDLFMDSIEIPVADQIRTLWSQLDTDSRAELLPELMAAAPPISFKTKRSPAGGDKLIEIEISDNGSYVATVYYRGHGQPAPPEDNTA
jgi:transcriptional regulator with XRE-family HTH domain